LFFFWVFFVGFLVFFFFFLFCVFLGFFVEWGSLDVYWERKIV
jgi:hypothetical protein